MPHRRQSTNAIARLDDLQPFTSEQEIADYLDNEKIECLICGKLFFNCGTHLKKHGITGRAYREKLALPLSKRGLLGTRLAVKVSNKSKEVGGAPKHVLDKMRALRTFKNASSRNAEGTYRGLTIRKYGRIAAKRSRMMLLQVIRNSVIGDTVNSVARRSGLSISTVGTAFRINLDLKAAFDECVKSFGERLNEGPDYLVEQSGYDIYAKSPEPPCPTP